MAAVGCSSDEQPEAKPGADAGAEPSEAFLFASSVPDGESSQLYMLALSELSGEVDLTQGIELPGTSSIFSKLGSVFVGNPEDVTVTRYEVDAANQFVKGKHFSMTGKGVTTVDQSLFFVLDAKRAYYIDAGTRQIIVW
ncbi:MAG TPA: hypothetical protein VMF89_14795, partial [Polyangiales bacterium]|nr:hypothetical protein [Polyangiales bacterium]